MGKKLGLALGGGAARGVAHIGVLQALTDAGIAIDYIAGTSAGAVVGSLFAGGISADQLARIAERTTWAHLLRPTVPRYGLVNTERLEAFLDTLLRGRTFDQLTIPFTCVATNLVTGAEVILNRGRVATAVRASASIPALFVPVTLDGQILIDGGAVNNIPVRVAREMGADVVVAVDVNAGAIPDQDPKGIIPILLQSLDIMQRNSLLSQIRDADLLLEPGTGFYSGVDLTHAPELIRHGRTVAQSQVKTIKRLLA